MLQMSCERLGFGAIGKEKDGYGRERERFVEFAEISVG